MKTDLPIAICLINNFFKCMRGFSLIYYANVSVCFEGLPETSEVD